MKLKIFNTMGRKVEEFIPIEDNRVGMYTCGPTVYNYAHIGNLRTYIFEDILRRTLEYIGYKVKHVMNVTDVGHLTDDADEGEDKIIKSAREKRKSVWEIADFYTKAFFRDTERLNIEKPTVVCKATEHVQDMINLIKRIEKKMGSVISLSVFIAILTLVLSFVLLLQIGLIGVGIAYLTVQGTASLIVVYNLRGSFFR